MTTRARRPARDVVLLLAAAVALQAIVWAVLVALLSARVGYGLHDLSDIPHYLWFAERVDAGAWPYRDFHLEYPPLSLLTFLAPMRDGTLATYSLYFTLEMLLVCVVTALVVTLTAMRLWPGMGRPLAAAAAFAAAAALAGGIALNRFDPAVGLVVALCMLALVGGHPRLSAAAAGLGFALKLAPIVLVPLILIVARRGRIWIVAVATLAAFVPFLPFLVFGSNQFSGTAGYQSSRGLQIESLAATPYLLLAASGGDGVRVVVPPGGSLVVEAAGTATLARFAPFLVLAFMVLAYALIWRARGRLRSNPDWIPPAALAVLLTVLCGNKVLSPQHLLWTLPLVALCLVCDGWRRRLAAVLCLLATGLTQVSFPAHYFGLRGLEAFPIVLVAARNALLLAATVVLLGALWRAGSQGADAP
jgi:hypothetical protein